MTSIIQKVRTSFTTQLTLWVASLVTVISVVVVGLLRYITGKAYTT